MKINIKPAPGKKVRKPGSGEFLSENGEVVEKSSFWIRRIQGGDVVPAEIIKESSEKAKKQGDK